MIKTDESALICDLAETYHIYDYRSLPLKMVAAFSAGLRENSRIKMAMAGIQYPLNTLLLAAVLDGINMVNWMLSKSSSEGSNPPQSVLARLLGREQDGGKEEMLFDSAGDYEKARENILRGR